MLVAHRSSSSGHSFTTDPTAASLKASLRHAGCRPAAPAASSGHSSAGLSPGDLQTLYPSLYESSARPAPRPIQNWFVVRPLVKAALLVTPILCGVVYHILQ
jgi:hypothetical protein